MKHNTPRTIHVCLAAPFILIGVLLGLAADYILLGIDLANKWRPK